MYPSMISYREPINITERNVPSEDLGMENFKCDKSDPFFQKRYSDYQNNPTKIIKKNSSNPENE